MFNLYGKIGNTAKNDSQFFNLIYIYSSSLQGRRFTSSCRRSWWRGWSTTSTSTVRSGCRTAGTRATPSTSSSRSWQSSKPHQRTRNRGTREQRKENNSQYYCKWFPPPPKKKGPFDEFLIHTFPKNLQTNPSVYFLFQRIDAEDFDKKFCSNRCTLYSYVCMDIVELSFCAVSLYVHTISLLRMSRCLLILCRKITIL